MKGTALVTGGTGGLGAAVTRRLLDEGWRVVVPWIDEDERERLAPLEGLELVRADLFDPAEVAHCAERAAADEAAPLRAVVNLVGGFGMGPRVHEAPVDEFERQLRLNLRPTYLTSQAAIPHLIAAGGGAIVCMSSRAAVYPFPGASGYVTSKSAVLGFVGALAAEYKADGIRVNAVLPSIIDTPGNRASMPDSDRKGWVSPEEIAKVIAYLCGEDSGVISGAHVPVYGVG
ncbi:NAD(P)-dependent dehydrogenase (short-subunit alcohol dehydrogenase family) [Prauserella shujinwangii]|uniref:NAD(P)-dependent dehydrogenase (Short-subunit alcohol dehydrogenase family) n=1 Tax=Prauserella shujinwangii TaxID=1453103 RepID=A0A2T0LW73_9PSEU|nr:SDR family NAD(P)-dependent oxidoreductase [Prauserella shujinwangii]PRX48219.1 NAD(P)-dependent dehydrogenase (short-subunit alcohol dehydrogenase family) [Prauserella shujinwangii]